MSLYSRSPRKVTVVQGDVITLRNGGLLYFHDESREALNFIVTPLGFQLYTQIKRKLGQPVDRVASTVKNYLDVNQFRQNHPKAYAKWATDAETQLTTIGHLCREAMQEFATELVEKYQPPNVSPDKAHMKNRIGEVIKLRGSHLGDTEKPFLEAI